MRMLLATGLILAVAAGATAQDRSTLFSNPVPPAREALDRLNLQQAWLTAVDIDGRRDGLLSIQPSGTNLLVQTRSGLTALLDGETGRLLWQVRLGEPYRTLLPPAINSYAVLTFNNGVVYGLERASGKLLWEYPLPADLSAPIVIDEERAFICTQGGRISVYRLPRPDLEGTPPPGSTIPESKQPRPLLLWRTDTLHPTDLAPLVGGDLVLLPSRNGRASAFVRDPAYGVTLAPAFRFNADAGFNTTVGGYGDVAYIGSQDSNLYAVSMTPSGRLIWRFSGGTPITRRPIALEKDVYVVSEGNGMARIDRATGIPVWRVPRGNQILPNNPAADRFLAANPKFLYVADHAGNLLVLSRERGNVLSTLETRDWVFPVPNEYNDRLYLAANNGLILCLHDRDFPTPFVHRKLDTSGNDLSKLPYDRIVHDDIEDQLKKDYISPMGRPEAMPLRQFLEELSKQYNLRILFREPVFEAEGKLELINRVIRTRDFNGKRVRDVLKDALKQADCDYFVLDRILIFPAKPKPPEKPDDKMKDEKKN
jgi:outer membrane protein assembly factor BamB